MDAALSVLESLTSAALGGSLSEKLRVTLLEAATRLVNALQKPEDAITKLAYQNAFFESSRRQATLLN
ncbi:hypothetical protein N0V86_008302 [Didymella sp. IMI 355093]|nr:hypothetical protein N0V86_008302 [Didymella sp. IMI 355093]